MLREVYRSGFYVDCSVQEFLHTGTVDLPALIFFTLTESFASPGKGGKIHLRDLAVTLKTWHCHYVPTCTAVITSFIQQYIWVRLSRVWGRPGTVSGILAMELHPGTRSDVCTRVFASSVSVYENTQKDLGNDDVIIVRCRWDDIDKGSPLGRPEPATVV